MGGAEGGERRGGEVLEARNEEEIRICAWRERGDETLGARGGKE